LVWFLWFAPREKSGVLPDSTQMDGDAGGFVARERGAEALFDDFKRLIIPYSVLFRSKNKKAKLLRTILAESVKFWFCLRWQRQPNI
jgi:hypothetical protein